MPRLSRSKKSSRKILGRVNGELGVKGEGQEGFLRADLFRALPRRPTTVLPIITKDLSGQSLRERL